MRVCLLCHPHKNYTNKGWYTHMATIHGIRSARACPVPHCHTVLSEGDLQAHLEAEHLDWKLSDGRFVFEVGA